MTNNFAVPALTIAHLYHGRWQVKLFFKWVKQHLRIKAFYVTSPNAVRTQVTASLNYVLKRHTAIKKASLRTPFVF